MKIGFLHSKNEFTIQMLTQLRETLSDHQLISWEAGTAAPAQDIEVLLTSGGVGKAELAGLEALMLIQTTSTGFETIDVEAASEMGIWASYAPSDLTGNATSVAEFVILLLLGISRDLQETLRLIRDSNSPVPRVHRSLNGRTVCVVGLGNIGLQVVDRLRPFGVLIIATDEHPENAPPGVVAFGPEQLLAAVADADYVVICARASKENEKLIDGKVIRAMKRGAVLVNVARGTLIDEEEVLLALRSGHISAIGFDVVREEPLSAMNPLLNFPQALITPHIAAFTDLMLDGTVDFIANVIGDLSVGKLPHSLLNRPMAPRNRFDSRDTDEVHS